MYSNGILRWRLAEQLTRIYCHCKGIGEEGVKVDIIRLASLNNLTLLSSIGSCHLKPKRSDLHRLKPRIPISHRNRWIMDLPLSHFIQGIISQNQPFVF